ncbi:MAG: cyclic nucleotide-binding domain-containing protein [Thermoanaerobaculia bacterium]
MTTIGLFRNATDFETYPAGKTVFEAGDPGHALYVVKDGEVDIVIHGNVVETVQPGGVFGEMALIESSVRSASAVARTDCALVPIDERRFSFLIQQTPQFALQVMKIMAERLRRFDEKL